MTAPIRITPDTMIAAPDCGKTTSIRAFPGTIEGYEVYRIVLDYEALHEGFVDRVDDLKVTRTGIDVAGGFAPGYSAKVLCNPPMKFLGRDSLGRDGLGKMLKATGMALVLVIDDERFAAVKATMALSKRPRKLPNGSSARPTWLFTRKMSLKMQAFRTSSLSEKKRKKIARKAGKASGKSRRRKSREQRQNGIKKTAQAGAVVVHKQDSQESRPQAHGRAHEKAAVSIGKTCSESALGIGLGALLAAGQLPSCINVQTPDTGADRCPQMGDQAPL